MLPFSIKQQKNSIKQARLRPKEMAIRKKYAGRNDQATQQKVTMEIQELYQRENFNAASGCLPLLVQLPIIMALYNIVINPLQYVLGQAAGISNALNLYYTTAHAAGGLGHTTAQASRGTIEVLAGIGDKLVGIKDFMLLKNGEAIDLTQVEYQIMEYFLKNQNTALDRLSILHHIWGESYYGEEKIVDVNIRRIRMKIEDEPSNPKYILTVWGYGYCFRKEEQ